MKPKSIKNIFNFYISICIIIASIFIPIILGFQNYSKNIKHFKKSINRNIQNILPIYKNYLWEIDYKNLEISSKLFFKSRTKLCELTVVNEFNKILYHGDKHQESCAKNNLISFEKKIFYKKKYIGKIILSFSTYFLKDKFKKDIFKAILLSLFLALLIILIITILFDKIVNENFVNISKKLEVISSGQYNINFELTNFKEFDNIVRNLNQMIKEIRIRDIQNKKLNEKLNSLINTIPVGLFILNEKGNYIEINNTVCEMLNMEKDEILSKKIENYSTEKFTVKYGFNVLNKIINEGKYEFEWQLKTKDGRIIDTIGTGVKILFEKELWVVIVLSDITYLKKLEKELTRKEKLESVGILAGGIAHDFNNILTSISGSIELIQIYLEKGDLTKAKSRLRNLNKSTNKAKSLTHQLLTFSKGGAPVKKKVENLSQLIIDTVDFILSGTAIEVNYDFDENLKPVEIDPDQISLAIENIILNAKSAMNNKGTIDIKAVNFSDFVKISIKDYGPGIPPHLMEKIWDPYFTTKKTGSGLGLTIVYSVIKKHNGDIKVYSKEGKFTDFQLFLPIAKLSEKINGKEKKLCKKENSNKNIKILIMEDNEDIQELISELCKVLNYEYVIVKNGEEAIERYKQEKFDIILMDLTIKGGMGGEQCIQKLKTIDSNIRAIVYSGYSDSPVMKEYEKYGFKAVLKKPFRIVEFKDAVEKSLN